MSTDIGTSRLRFGRILIFLLVAGLFLVLYLKFGPKRGADAGNKGSYTNIPQEIQIKYLPATFRVDIDEEDALAIITNPKRYRKEFNDLVRTMNLSVLEHVSNRMNLGETVRSQIRQEYEKSHPYLRNLYFQDFLSLQDSTSSMARTWYNSESKSAVDVLREVASKYTCFLVNQIMATVLNTENGSYYGKGRKVETPCGIAIQEALNPMMKRMEASASIVDFSRSKNMLEERVEKVITELATYEVQSKKGLNKQMQTKVFGMAVSSTDIEISAISIMKLGFKLDQYFGIDLNTRNEVVTITLPEPQILSHSVYPKLDKLDIGWLREVKGVDLNTAFDLLRGEFIREAEREDAFEKAKAQAQEVMGTMMGPIINGLSPNYKLRVKFHSIPSEEFQVKDEFTDLN